MAFFLTTGCQKLKVSGVRCQVSGFRCQEEEVLNILQPIGSKAGGVKTAKLALKYPEIGTFFNKMINILNFRHFSAF